MRTDVFIENKSCFGSIYFCSYAVLFETLWIIKSVAFMSVNTGFQSSIHRGKKKYFVMHLLL